MHNKHVKTWIKVEENKMDHPSKIYYFFFGLHKPICFLLRLQLSKDIHQVLRSVPVKIETFEWKPNTTYNNFMINIVIGIIHRFSHLVTLLFHKWLHVRLNHKDACILTLTKWRHWIIKLGWGKHWSLTSTARVTLPVRSIYLVDEYM